MVFPTMTKKKIGWKFWAWFALVCAILAAFITPFGYGFAICLFMASLTYYKEKKYNKKLTSSF